VEAATPQDLQELGTNEMQDAKYGKGGLSGVLGAAPLDLS
jgi:hypothetical protein